VFPIKDMNAPKRSTLPSTAWYQQLRHHIRQMTEADTETGTPIVPGKDFETRLKQDEESWRKFGESLAQYRL